MKKISETSKIELEKVLVSFNTNKKLELSISEMLIKKVAYGQNIKSYLIAKGYCDKNGNKINHTPFLVADMNAVCRDIALFLKNKNKKQSSKPISPNQESWDIFEGVEDSQLVSELRARGYEVTAKKTTVIEL